MKRIFDIIFSIIALLILSPLILIISCISFFIFGPNIFFLQERPGMKCKIFKLIKFRTMSDKKGRDGSLLPDKQRLNIYGKILRKLSLDELPEFINVLKGEMSIVGPRPLLEEYINLYSEEQIKRHDVLPGITGWAQINGRNNLEWNKKFDLDIWYIKNKSFLLDIKIIFITIKNVLLNKNISKKGHVTTDKFEGNTDKFKGNKE